MATCAIIDKKGGDIMINFVELNTKDDDVADSVSPKTLKQMLEAFFDQVEELQPKYFCVAISNIKVDDLEFIINPLSNLKGKREYYLSAYNDDLQLVNAPTIRIVDFQAGDSFEEIQDNFKSERESN